jgi:hypothetical protein
MISKVCIAAVGCMAFVGWAGTAAGGEAQKSACTPGATTFGGARALVFCGPAKAKVTVGTTKLAFVQGSCERRQNYLRVDIGTRILGKTAQPKPDYFQLVIGKTPGSAELPVSKDGTYGRALITVIKGGTEYLPDTSRGKVTLKLKRTRGTFTAKTADGQAVSGSFSC